MKICIFGAGAVGGHLAARLLAAGTGQISMVARGAHLDAIRSHGISLQSDGEELTGRPAFATDDASNLSPQDLVIVTLRAPSLPGAAASIARLLAPGATALFTGNGIPWWWNHGLQGRAGPLRRVDPDRTLWDLVTPERALGASIVSSNAVIAPGMVKHRGGNRWLIGEPDGSNTPRLQAIVDLFSQAGLNAERASDLRQEIWLKLFRNIAYYAVCGLTRLRLGEIPSDSELAGLGRQMVSETLEVVAAMGWNLEYEANIAGLFNQSGGPPAMLQDIELGRPTEVEAVFGQVQDFARQMSIATPALDMAVALLRGLDRSIQQKAFVADKA